MPRIRLLDPLRPAHDLLEDLLDGLHGCHLLFHEYSKYDGHKEDFDDDQTGQLAQRLDSEFETALRDEAEANRSRVL